MGRFQRKLICRGSVLPDPVAKARAWIGLQWRLRQKPGEKTGQRISAATLREKRIPG